MGAINSHAINVAVGAENATRIFRFKLEPDYPVGSQRLVFVPQIWLTTGYSGFWKYPVELKLKSPVGIRTWTR